MAVISGDSGDGVPHLSFGVVGVGVPFSFTDQGGNTQNVRAVGVFGETGNRTDISNDMDGINTNFEMPVTAGVAGALPTSTPTGGSPTASYAAIGFLGGRNPFVETLPMGAFGQSDHTGVAGIANKPEGVGVFGSSVNGVATGVLGDSNDAHGVLGKSNSTLNPRDAPGGSLDLNIKAGVWGDNVGGGYGVRGTSIGPLGTVGVHGHGTSSGVEGFGAVQGVLGQTTGSGVGVLGAGIQAGVKGEAGGPGVGHVGVWGRSGGLPADFDTSIVQIGGRGVLGAGVSVGVQGMSTTGHGVDGLSQTGIGVGGATGGTGPNAVGVFGRGGGAGSLAGKFEGNVDIQGNLHISGSISKDGGGFRIDHPLAPTERYLNHSFVESSERKNVYDGIAVLDDDGQAIVELPAWFEALNSDFRYQLTCLGSFAPVYIARKLSDGRFVIAGGAAKMEISWQVTGIRSDNWARANPLDVEEDKHELERARYRHASLQPDNVDVFNRL